MQYFFATAISLIVVMLADIDIRNLNIQQRWYMITLSLIWYIDYRCFYKALKKLHTASVLIISSLSIFISYVLNTILFPDMAFSWMKIFIALCFVGLIITYIIVSKKHKHRDIGHILHNVINHSKESHEGVGANAQLSLRVDKAYIWAIISTVMASLLYVWLGYGLKNNFITAFQASIVPDTFTFLIAARVYGEHNQFNYKKLWSIILYHGKPYMAIGILSVTNSILIYMAIQYSDPSTISIMRLVGILLTPVLAQIFLHDKLTTLQWYLTILWMLLMIIFTSIA